MATTRGLAASSDACLLPISCRHAAPALRQLRACATSPHISPHLGRAAALRLRRREPHDLAHARLRQRVERRQGIDEDPLLARAQRRRQPAPPRRRRLGRQRRCLVRRPRVGLCFVQESLVLLGGGRVRVELVGKHAAQRREGGEVERGVERRRRAESLPERRAGRLGLLLVRLELDVGEPLSPHIREQRRRQRVGGGEQVPGHKRLWAVAQLLLVGRLQVLEVGRLLLRRRRRLGRQHHQQQPAPRVALGRECHLDGVEPVPPQREAAAEEERPVARAAVRDEGLLARPVRRGGNDDELLPRLVVAVG
mmetsp:Transcript_32864/g.103190  ORF Transcript_32864/g.103190 Transcript_32864/m.103190 type:complete len:309 (+) Transcript_32864:250-1176(+)